MHSLHSDVMDPDLNLTLNNSSHRAACYRCHPGSTTRCLRGAMSAAVAPDGSMGIQCQNCHGNMKAVGSTNRVGWFMEPNCQSCHSGTATRNSGQIRYTSAFETNGTVRVPADFTFATQSNNPAPGISLYRFSAGHGGLQCSACHGSTHAEFPSTHLNDNVRNKALQGHKGVMVECSSCHTSQPATMTGGPHGMHPTVQDWVNAHGDLIEFGAATLAQCRTCHGSDYRGTVLSRAQGDHAVVGHFDNTNVTLSLFRGAIVGCYNCHNGAGENSVNTNAAPVVSNVTTNVSNDGVATFTVPSAGAGAAVRIISQPGNGVVSGGTGNVFHYFPPAGFVGTDTFTFAAYNGSKNSNLGTGTVYVTQGIFSIGAVALVPSEHPALWPVPFNAVCWPTNISGTVSIDWNFGDSSPHGTNAHATHAYSLPGLYNWSVISRISTASVTNRGAILIQECVALTATGGAGITIYWPKSMCDTVLESSGSLGPAAHWMAVTNQPEAMGNQMRLITAPDSASTFFRIRQAW
jgi:hypothetical protein